jgi:glycine/serine hydroxymethyltransferase
MAAKAVALAEARQPEFQTYAQSIADNAKSLAEGSSSAAAKLVTGGTDNHIVLVDVSSFGLTGRQAESPSSTPAWSPPQLGPAGPQRRLVHLRHPASARPP